MGGFSRFSASGGAFFSTALNRFFKSVWLVFPRQRGSCCGKCAGGALKGLGGGSSIEGGRFCDSSGGVCLTGKTSEVGGNV